MKRREKKKDNMEKKKQNKNYHHVAGVATSFGVTTLTQAPNLIQNIIPDTFFQQQS